MPKKKTIKEIFEEIDEENRKIVEECKRKREEQRRAEQEGRTIEIEDTGSKLVGHPMIDDPITIDQFSVLCSEGLRCCETNMYVYPDHVLVRRSSCGGNVMGPGYCQEICAN